MSWKLAGMDCFQKCAKFAVPRNLLNCLSAKARRAPMKKKSICSKIFLVRVGLFIRNFGSTCERVQKVIRQPAAMNGFTESVKNHA